MQDVALCADAGCRIQDILDPVSWILDPGQLLAFLDIRLVHHAYSLFKRILWFESKSLDTGAIKEFFIGTIGMLIVKQDKALESDNFFDQGRKFFDGLIHAGTQVQVIILWR